MRSARGDKLCASSTVLVRICRKVRCSGRVTCAGRAAKEIGASYTATAVGRRRCLWSPTDDGWVQSLYRAPGANSCFVSPAACSS